MFDFIQVALPSQLVIFSTSFYHYLFLVLSFPSISSLRYYSSLFILVSYSLFLNKHEISFDNIFSYICARRPSSLVVFISLCGFYLIQFLFFLLFFHILSFFRFFFLFHERAHPLVDSSSSFSLIRAYFVHILLPLALTLSLSHSVFNLFLFPFSFYLTPLLPSYTALGDVFLFSCHSSFVRQNLRSLIFPSPPFFLLIRRLRRSLSIPRRSRRRFLYCICSPVSSLLLCQRPRLRYLSRFSTHVNARSLIFLGSLFLAFVPPSRASARAIRHPLRDIFRFPFRYVRSVSDT